MPPARERILTGDRPSGRLHLGHRAGSPANYVRLQDVYECFFIVADLHTLTTLLEMANLREIEECVRPMVLDPLSVGVDPGRSSVFLYSALPETFELNLYFRLPVSVARLERIPSLTEIALAAHLPAISLGLMGNPVLQAADSLLPRAHQVPVGTDNEAHAEVARELVRRFNHL